MDISVIGLGKLGLCTAACFAAKGHTVIGVDNNQNILEALQKKQCPIDENGLIPLLEKGWNNLAFTENIEHAVLNSQITLIIVPTPSQSDGAFTNRYVEEVLRSIAPILGKKENFHVIDVVSTVMPGSSEETFRPLLENLSGKICGKDFGLVYNPEFIALGSVIKDFLHPDMILIGASDNYSSDLVKELYLSTCENRPLIAAMSLVNAEITKLSLNCFVTMKISFANELASICEKVPGANIDSITKALGLDSRIGPKYLKGGLGFGGPCFPRDNLAFQRFFSNYSADARLAPQVVAINHSVVERLLGIVRSEIGRSGRIALLGLSYKPDTHIIDESQPTLLAKKLTVSGYSIRVHDPKALSAAMSFLGPGVVYCEDPYSCVYDSDAVLLLTDWDQYRHLDWKRVAGLAKDKPLLLDCWRMVEEDARYLFRYKALGLGPVIQSSWQTH